MIERTSEDNGRSGLSPRRLSERSPLLGQFRDNPFRLLQLPVSTDTQRAVWEAQKAVTMLRAGLPAGEPLLAWLPEHDELDLQRAAQRIEEPFERLVEQLLWFDLETDRDSDELLRALADLDSEACAKLLGRDVDPFARIPEEAPAGDEPQPAPEDTRDVLVHPAQLEGVAHALDVANLGLLLAGAVLHGQAGATWVLSVPAESDVEAWTWSTGERAPAVAQAHSHVPCGHTQRHRASRCADLWSRSLSHWNRLLEEPAFLRYLGQAITSLEDETLTTDDVAMVRDAVLARLVDLLVAEMKLQLIEGRVEVVGILAGIPARADLAAEHWNLAYRPLRHLFRAQIEEMDPASGEDGDPDLEGVPLYVNRLVALKNRWKGVDGNGSLGLAALVDGAVEKLAQRSDGTALHHAPVKKLEIALGLAKELATSESVRTLAEAQETRMRAVQEEQICHFCGYPKPAKETAVILKGTKELYREQVGLQTRISRGVGHAVIARCQECEDAHEYLQSVGFRGLTNSIWIALGVSLVWLGAMTMIFVDLEALIGLTPGGFVWFLFGGTGIYVLWRMYAWWGIVAALGLFTTILVVGDISKLTGLGELGSIAVILSGIVTYAAGRWLRNRVALPLEGLQGQTLRAVAASEAYTRLHSKGYTIEVFTRKNAYWDHLPTDQRD